MANIIFDFDGTIADSFALVAAIVHDLMGQHEPLPAGEIERLRGMTLRSAAKEVKLPLWKIPFLLAKGRKQMWASMDTVQPFAGVPAAIQQLRAEGHNLYIMSSNSVQNIELFLERNDMSDEFIRIYGSVGLLGKARVLRKVLSQNELEPAVTCYVGDEVRDINAAHKAGIRIASVTWGYNNAEVLAAHQPDVLITDVKQLTQLQ